MVLLHLLDQHGEHLGGQGLLQHLQELCGLATDNDSVRKVLHTLLQVTPSDVRLAHLHLLQEEAERIRGGISYGHIPVGAWGSGHLRLDGVLVNHVGHFTSSGSMFLGFAAT